MSLNELSSLLADAGFESDEKSYPKNFLNTGLPHLNDIIAGDPEKGIPSGRMIEIAGESSSGKTMLASMLMISAQKQGGFAGFWDHERSYDVRLSIKQGMSVDSSQWLYKKGQSFEKSMVDAKKVALIIREKAKLPIDKPIVFVFDSFASMVPLSKIEDSKGKTKEVDEYSMNDTTALARAASAVLPAVKIWVDDLNVCMVFLNQMAETMSMYGEKTKTKGGKSLPFYADIRLMLSGSEVYAGTGDNKKLSKKEMKIHTKKNKIYMPKLTVKSDFIFEEDGSGSFDVIGSYADYLKDIGAIKSAGPRVEWGGGKPFMSQVKEELNSLGEEAALQTLKELHKQHIAI